MRRILTLAVLCGMAAGAAPPVRLTETPGGMELENGLVRARFTPSPAGVLQEYFGRAGDGWKLLLRSFRPPRPRPAGTAPLYGDVHTATRYRLLATEALRQVTSGRRGEGFAEVVLTGAAGGNRIRQVVRLEAGAGHFSSEVSAELAEARLEYLLSTYVFSEGPEVDFSHAPAIKRGPEHVMGDRVFSSPALILQKGGAFAALAPQVELLNREIVLAPAARQIEFQPRFFIRQDPATVSMPAALDLEFRSGMTPLPLLAYGLLDAFAENHVYWWHRNANGEMVRDLSTNRVRYGFDLFLDAAAPPQRGYARVSRFFWERYGRQYLAQPRPQTMPYAGYARLCYPAAFAYTGMQDKHRTWQEFELGGQPVGAATANFRNEWFDDLGFTVWWNNARDALGMDWWGRRLPDAGLAAKARRILNLALAAPQDHGLFPSFFDLGTQRWVGNYWEFPAAYDPAPLVNYMKDSDHYQTAAASKTAAHLLRYRRLVEPDPRILPYVRRYGDFLVEQVAREDRVPAWFTPDRIPVPAMQFNSEAGVHIWFLTELYGATRERKYLAAAERLAAQLRDRILPRQRWVDFEALQSCSRKAGNTFDEHTRQGPRNTLSMHWALEGFHALYRATRRPGWLDAAQQVADYAVLYQAVWQPHYVFTAYAFGGFSVQNSDAEWLDARQGEFAGALMNVALDCGRQDLLERAVAAMHASLALVNHPRHLSNRVYNYPNYPLGLGPENVDHGGFPQSPGRTAPGWAELSALAAVADLMRELGGAYVHFGNGLHAGIDGVYVTSSQREGKILRVNLRNQLAALPDPYREPFTIDLVLDGLPPGDYRLVLNGSAPRRVHCAGRTRVEVEISPSLP